MKKKVLVLKVDDYDFDILYKRIKEALLKHFDLNRIIKPKDNILLKPNILMPASPDYAITTHPSVVAAVGVIFKERGCRVSLADNPAIFDSEDRAELAYSESGMEDICNKYESITGWVL